MATNTVILLLGGLPISRKSIVSLLEKANYQAIITSKYDEQRLTPANVPYPGDWSLYVNVGNLVVACGGLAAYCLRRGDGLAMVPLAASVYSAAMIAYQIGQAQMATVSDMMYTAPVQFDELTEIIAANPQRNYVVDRVSGIPTLQYLQSHFDHKFVVCVVDDGTALNDYECSLIAHMRQLKDLKIVNLPYDVCNPVMSDAVVHSII